MNVLHITDIQRWKSVPWEALSPAALQAHRTGGFPHHAYFRKTAGAIPLLKAIFDSTGKVEVSHKDLQRVADLLSISAAGHRLSRKDLLDRIIECLWYGETPDQIEERQRKMDNIDKTKTSSTLEGLDPFTETVCDTLPKDEMREHGEYNKRVDKLKRARKVAHRQKTRKDVAHTTPQKKRKWLRPKIHQSSKKQRKDTSTATASTGDAGAVGPCRKYVFELRGLPNLTPVKTRC